MRRETLERYQVLAYLAAILAGLASGAAAPVVAPVLEALLWPALALLLFATFTQVPVARFGEAFRDGRFTATVLAGNFVLIPLLVWALMALVPDDPAVRLGVLLVLLVPCTDWFITFAHQAGGDTHRAIAVTPALLAFQIMLLPIYLSFLVGPEFAQTLPAGRMAGVFAVVIALPLAASWLMLRRASRGARHAVTVERLGWLPVPLLALVLFLVAASQVEAVLGSLPLMAQVLPAFLLFLAGAAALGVVLHRLLALPAAQGRTLLFSLATRNSFVVLPLALALPAGWEAAAVVIVFQSLVELFAMLVFLWLVPRLLIR